MKPISLAALSGPIVSNAIIIEQTQRLIKPRPTPPVPAKAMTFSGLHQMPSVFLLHPIFDISKAYTGVADPKIIDPSPEDRVN